MGEQSAATGKPPDFLLKETPQPRSRHPLRVLLLEDSPSDAELVVATLRRGGYDVQWERVETEEDYLAALDRPVDIVVADYQLPQFDVVRALRWVAERGLDTPLIVVSGMLSDSQAAEVLDAGAVDYLLKDRLARLAGAVGHALHQRHLRREGEQTRVALRASQERFAIAFQASPAALAITRLADGRFIDVNDALLRLYGYSREEVVGRTSAELGMWIDPALREVVTRDVRAKRSLREIDTTVRTRSGELRHVLTSLELIELDGEECILAMAQDVTERKRAEAERLQLAREQAAREQAEEARRRFAFLAEASRTLASSLDYETTLTSVARLAVPSLADLCVVELVEEDGDIRRVAVAHADPQQEEWARSLLGVFPAPSDAADGAAAVMRTGQPELTSQTNRSLAELFPVARPADPVVGATLAQLRPCSRIIVPLVARGHTLGALTFLRHGDALGGYDQEQLHWAEELASRAALAVDNARLFREAQVRLRERDALVRQKDEVLAVVTHDLQNPLTAVKGWAQTARRAATQATGPGAERVATAIAGIEEAAERMALMLAELVDLARLEKGELLDLHRARTDLLPLVQAVAQACQEQTERHTIEVRGGGPPIVGAWDRPRLYRVIENLVSNAVKYSPDGGRVEVTLARERSKRGDVAVLRVRDHGVGIPAAELSRVFERAFRGSNVAGQIEGTGLGLASARQIIEQHGGTIEVESTLGAGSTFIVRLPVA